MSNLKITLIQIRKIDHHIYEIRERALLSILSKLKYGFTFEDELAGPKELLIFLLKWFEQDIPGYQEEVIQTISHIITSSVGQTLIKMISANRILNDLTSLNKKLYPKFSGLLNNIVEHVRTQCDDSHKEYIDVPKLNMPPSHTSEIIDESLQYDAKSMTKNSKVLRNDDSFTSGAKVWDEVDDRQLFDLPGQGVKIYLMPWIQLCDSDVRKIVSNEECLRVNDSVERATYFFIHILLKDFPPDVFLNRPTTLKTFQSMINGSKFRILSMEALSSYFDSVNIRIKQLYDSSLRHCKKSPFNNYETRGFYDDDRERYISNISIDRETVLCDPLMALNQLPLPVFCLDTMHTVVNFLDQTISQTTREQQTLSTREITAAFTLKFKALSVLLRIVNGTFWRMQNVNRFTEEIVQKIVQLLRVCGNALDKFRISCVMNEVKDSTFRICHMRMLVFCISFTQWCDYSPILPRTFVSSLFNCLDDISFALVHPKFYEKLYKFLQFQQLGSLEDQNKLKAYSNIKEVVDSMSSAIQILQNIDKDNNLPDTISIIKRSLVSLEYHKNVKVVSYVLNVFCLKISKWMLSNENWQTVRDITLRLLAHSSMWIQEEFYTGLQNAVRNVLGGLIKTNDELQMYDESSLKFLIDPTVILEISCFGVISKSKQVSQCAKSIIQYLIKGKLLLSDAMWRTLLEAIIPSFPVLHASAAHDDEFGKSIVKTLDLEIGECMLIPKIELIKGNIRLLYSQCFTAQMEGSNNLMKFLYLEEESNRMLPKSEYIRADILSATLKSVKIKNFNVNKPQDPNFYEEGALLQVINLLKSNMSIGTNNNRNIDTSFEKSDDFLQVDPSFCRSALAQLAVMLQQVNLHEIFCVNMGCDLIKHYLSVSLVSSEFTTFPESAISCISILNSLCYTSSSVRLWISEEPNVLLNIIRAILLFPSDENFVVSASQLLCVASFSSFILNSYNSEHTSDYWTNNLSLHHAIVARTSLPFMCESHSKTSSHRMNSNEEQLLKQDSMIDHLRIHWSIIWFGGLDKVLRWPYVPEVSYKEMFDPQLMIRNVDLALLKATSPIQGCVSALYQIQNATSHNAVNNGVDTLMGYVLMSLDGKLNELDFDSLPWCSTLRRFLTSPPASPKDLILLLRFLEFLPLYLKLFQNSCRDFSNVTWIIESVLEAPYGVCALLKKDDDGDWVDNCDLFSFKLKQKLIQLIYECCKFCNSIEDNKKFVLSFKNGIVWCSVVYHLNDCLSTLQINDMNSLAYSGQIVECLTHLLNSPHHGLAADTNKNEQRKLLENLINLCECLHVKDDYYGYKGFSLVYNSLLIFARLIHIFQNDTKEIQNNVEYWIDDSKHCVLSICMVWQKSYHVLLRTLSLKVLSGMVLSGLGARLEKKYSDCDSSLMEEAIIVLSDLTEASILREQAAILLCNLLATRYNSKAKNNLNNQDLYSFLTSDFFNKLSSTLTNICLDEIDDIDSGENISLGYLSNREKYEVAFSKKSINNIPIKLTITNLPKCSIGLVINTSNVIYNILMTSDEIPETMLKSEIFRMLFRCIALQISCRANKYAMCASVCRTLYKAAELSQEVHNVLLNTQDCVSAFLNLFINSDYSDCNEQYMEMLKWGYFLLGCFMETSHGYNYILENVLEIGLTSFFKNLLITISDCEYKDIIPSSLYCLVTFLNSYTSYHSDIDISLENFFDNVTSNESVEFKKLKEQRVNETFQICEIESSTKRIDSKKEQKYNLDNAVFGEEFCFYLLELYLECNITNVDRRVNCTNFDFIASALCNVLGISNKAKSFAVNMKFVDQLVGNLNEIQYFLMTSAKPQNIVRNRKKLPIIHYLNWTILLLCNIVSNCDVAKNECVENNLVSPVNKLWPWILSCEMSRFHAIQMLSSYTNSCIRASHSMCVTVGTHSLLAEVIDLLLKEMNLVSRSHPLVTLEGCIEILKNVSCHIHCRTIIIKSEVFACLNKIHPAITKRQSQWRRVETMWESFCSVMSRYPEGQSKIAEYTGVLCAFVHQANGLMLTVIRNCAFNSFNRPRYLASAELLHLFLNTLSSDRPLSEKICVCTAVWALCANNHKSKLSMKTLGMTARLTECLQRLKCTSDDSEEAECAVQIMTYVLNMITVT